MNKILEALKSREWSCLVPDPAWANNPNVQTWGCKDCGQAKKVGHATDCHYVEAIREAESWTSKDYAENV